MENLISKKQYKLAGIYQIRNLINNKIYLGSAYNLYNRYRIHKSTLINNKHDNEHLQRSFNRYGRDNFVFELLEIVGNLTNIYDIEVKYLNKYFDYGKNCYNMNEETNPNKSLIKWNKSRMKTFELVSPNNEIHKFKGYSTAAKFIGGKCDSTCIWQLFNGKSKSYKGWRLVENINYDYKNPNKIKGKGARLHNVKLLSPEGIVYGPIFNMESFSIEHNVLSSALYNIISGRIRTYNGWSLFTGSYEKLLEKNAKVYDVNLTSPDGKVITEIKNLTKFCKENNLSISSMKSFIMGNTKKTEYKGWKRITK